MSILKEFKEKNKKLRHFRYQLERENFNVGYDNSFTYVNWRDVRDYSEEEVIKKINEYCRDIDSKYHKFRLHKLYELVEVNLDEYREK